jgi:hypothetical protein
VSQKESEEERMDSMRHLSSTVSVQPLSIENQVNIVFITRVSQTKKVKGAAETQRLPLKLL